MVKLEKIHSSLFPKLYSSFLIDDDPLSNEQDWRGIFDYQWETGHDHCGYALLDDDQIVGMLGMIFSERLIDDRVTKFCNLHTWWVREDHRGRSLTLLRPILKLDDCTITHFTPCDKVRAISKRLGFQDLNSQLRILLPNRLLWDSPDPRAQTITYDIPEILQRVSPTDARILNDHEPYGCGHLWVGTEQDGCYVLYTHVVRHRLPYCHIHYISNREVFRDHESSIRSSLLKRHQVRFLAIDTRLVEADDFPMSFKFWAPAHALYKSTRVSPQQVDNLYSDVVFLKLSVLPDISHELSLILQRGWPLARRHWPSSRGRAEIIVNEEQG